VFTIAANIVTAGACDSVFPVFCLFSFFPVFCNGLLSFFPVFWNGLFSCHLQAVVSDNLSLADVNCAVTMLMNILYEAAIPRYRLCL